MVDYGEMPPAVFRVLTAIVAHPMRKNLARIGRASAYFGRGDEHRGHETERERRGIQVTERVSIDYIEPHDVSRPLAYLLVSRAFSGLSCILFSTLQQYASLFPQGVVRWL